MPRLSPRACLCLALPVWVVTAGCGRFGFEQLSFEREQQRPSAATGAEDDGDDAAPDTAGNGDGGLSTDSADASGSGNPGMTPGTTDDAATPGPSTDAGLANTDASLPPVTLEPLPTNIDCSSGFTGLVACDNFSGDASGVLVSTNSYGGSASTDQYFTGSVSQELTGAHVSAQFNGLTSGSVFLRFSLFVPGGFNIQGINVASVGDLNTGNDFGLDLNLMRNGELELKSSGDGAVNKAGSYVLPRNRWLCVLLKVENIANSGGSARVLIDDREIIAANNIDTEPPGGITGASAGIDWAFNQQGPATLHVDNFVVTRDHPSACP